MLKEKLKKIKWFVVDRSDGVEVFFDELQGVTLSYKEYGADFDIYFQATDFSTLYGFETKEEAVECAKEKIKEKYEENLKNLLEENK